MGFCFFEVGFFFAYLYGMSFSETCASPFWLPDTVLLCALLLSRPRNWWIYIVGVLPIRLFSPISQGFPLWFLLVMFGIDSAKGLLVAAAMRWFIKDAARLGSVKEFGLFCLFAVLLAPAASAFAGAAALHGMGKDYWAEWGQSFMGDAMTHLVITPAVLYWLFSVQGKIKPPSPKRRVEALVVAVGLIVTGWMAFGTNASGASALEAHLYTPVLFLFWAAIRFGMPGAAGAVAVITFFSVNAAIRGNGPFSGESPTSTALKLQEFLLMRSVPLYLIAILIQQRKDVEQSLRESEGRFRVMADTAPVLIWMSGTDKLCDFFNRGWLEFTGRALEQELGNGWADGVHPEDLRRCVEIYHSNFDTRQSFEMEYRLRRHDGDYRWILDRGVPRYGADGEFIGYIGTAIDLTDRKRAEEARQNLIHASRLAVMGEFTAMVAHELNQPLTAILNNTDAVKMLLDLQVAPLDEVRQALADIRKDDLRAAEAIRRIRALVSKREMEMRLLDVNETVSEVVHLAVGDAMRRGVQIHEEYSAPLPAVRGDTVHLQQVVLNLLLNGMDAMKDNPVSERHLLVSTSRNGGDFIEVSVSDIGHGVTPENLSRLFDSFFTTKPGGMGIGLSMARSIVQMHSGRLWAENNQGGRGTTFCFTLPALAAETTQAQPAANGQATERLTEV